MYLFVYISMFIPFMCVGVFVDFSNKIFLVK